MLETLITATKSNAREAAAATLETQTTGTSITSNRVIVAQSVGNATKSSQALVPFIDRKERDVPTWVGFTARDAGNGEPGVVVGLARIPDFGRNAVLHAAVRPPPEVRAPACARIGVLWSLATQELKSQTSEDSWYAPGVLERYGMLGELRAKTTGGRGVYKSSFSLTDQGRANAIERHIASETMRALPSAAGGVTRSFLSLATSFTVSHSTFAAAAALADEGKSLYTRLKDVPMSQRETDRNTCATLGKMVNTDKRLEPLCTPAPRLAIGLRINELLRRFMFGRTRKNEPCKVILGMHTNAEITRDLPNIMDTEPMPLATIVDFDVRCAPGAHPTHSAHSAQCERVDGSVCIHVCLDGAVRVPEMVASLRSPWEKRGILYAASSQASYVGDVGASVSAAAANTNINSSKKISCADVNTLCLLSVMDVYGGGLSNVQRSFVGTPYSGCYGPTVDTGITAAGLLGHFYRSDKRGHGSMTLSTKVADQLAARLAHCYHVEVGEKKYAVAPVSTRGIPHGYVAGVHKVLDDYVDALRRVADDQGRGSSNTCEGLFCLPYAAFTQALRPDVEATADSTLRYCFRNPHEVSCVTGRSYLCDATAEEDAIVTEPLFRRPCQCSVGDNPFSTSYPYVDSVFNAMNALSLIARECGGVDELHGLICTLHNNERHRSSGPCLTWAADACVLLFGVIFPNTHAIAEPVVSQSYARLLPALAKVERGAACDWTLDELIGEELAGQARSMWKRCTRPHAHLCPWRVGIAPFLSIIMRKMGSHHNTPSELGEFRTALNTLCSKCAWLFYSEDGLKPPAPPNPASGCKTMNDVRRPTLDPIFVACGDSLSTNPRGGLVGLHPFQLRQIYSLMLGAHLVDEVQCVRNEGAHARARARSRSCTRASFIFRFPRSRTGGLLLRESSLSTILEKDGSKRSAKGIAREMMTAPLAHLPTFLHVRR